MSVNRRHDVFNTVIKRLPNSTGGQQSSVIAGAAVTEQAVKGDFVVLIARRKGHRTK